VRLWEHSGLKVCKPLDILRPYSLYLDSRKLHQLEDWQPTSSSSSKGSSKFLNLITDFQIRITTSSKRISLRSGEKDQLPVNFKRRIKENFVDTLCFLFDGLLNTAMAPDERKDGRRGTRISGNRIITLKDIVSEPHDTHVRGIYLICASYYRRRDYS
jgi:hypothetical protein